MFLGAAVTYNLQKVYIKKKLTAFLRNFSRLFPKTLREIYFNERREHLYINLKST